MSDELRAALDRRTCVAVLGAGVTQAVTRGAECSTWSGLLRVGVKYAADMRLTLDGKRGLDRLRADIDDGDLLSAADKLYRALVKAGQFGYFMSQTIGQLKAVEPSLLGAIAALELPALSTNYDLLFATYANRQAITWQERALMVDALESRDFVLHIHGVWLREDTVILGSHNYGQISSDFGLAAVDHALGLARHMLLIGCGGTLTDPHFTSLFESLERVGGFLADRHFWLLTSKELDSSLVQETLNRVPSIAPVVYGDDYGELSEFLGPLATGPAAGIRGRSKAQLLDEPLLPGRFTERLNLRSLWPQLLLEPTIKSRARFEAEMGLWTWFSSRPSSPRVVVIGEVGAGKSTALRAAALRHTGTFTWKHAKEDLGRPDTDVVFIDGLDEVGLERREDIAAFARDWDGELWLGCRSSTFLHDAAISSIAFDDVLSLMPFTLDDSIWFVRQLSTLLGLDGLLPRFTEILDDQAVRNLVSNPLCLTLAVFLIAEHERGIGDMPNLESRYGLYGSFYDYVVEYEVDRTTTATPAGTLSHPALEAHIQAALAFYNPSLSLGVDHGSDMIIGNGLLVEVDVGKDGDQRIRGFVHESFREFTIAQAVIQALQFSQSSVAPLILSVAYNDDVNSLIREGFLSLDRGGRARAAESLEEIFEDSGSDERLREHVIYYLGRLSLDDCPELLIRVFRDPNEDWLLRRSAALGAILYGESEIESEFLEALLLSEALLQQNLAIQRVYFGDALGDIHSASESDGSWERTRVALVRRLGEADARAVHLRWWDLLTYAAFVEGSHGGVTAEELEMVKAALASVPELGSAVSEEIVLKVRGLISAAQLAIEMSAGE